ncbi:MAG: chemotaxis protein CheA [Magnetococcales bacterium]|nr:chemotaxis protein CheA [Magnetococcales bacterium]
MATFDVGEMQQLFLQEMEELLQQMEEDMLCLEADPGDVDRVHALFRSFHTLKGGAGLSGFTALSRYTHKAENVLDGVRSGKLAITPGLMSALLEALDCLKGFLLGARGGTSPDELRLQSSLERFAQLTGGPVEALSPDKPTPPPAPTVVSRQPDALLTYFLRLRFHPDLFAERTDPLVLIKDLEALGTLLIFPHTHAVPPLEQLNPRLLSLWWTVILKTTASQKKLKTILMFFLEGHDLHIELIDGGPQEILDQLAIDSHVTDPSRRRLIGQTNEGEIGPTNQGVPAPQATPAPSPLPTPPVATQPPAQRATAQVMAKKPPELVRVNIQKLDTLINLIGEIILVHTRLRQAYETLSAQDEAQGGALQLEEILGQIVDDHDRIMQELHVQAMKVRMVPVGNVLFPLKRLVRDFSEQSQKPMQMHLLGEETEVDKTIVDKLNGPLTHLVRNAMDHGIEKPEIRRQRGKHPEGRLLLQVANRKNAIVIELTDDGAGVDYDRVLAIARQRGLISEADRPTHAEILQFLFRSGFSTAREVSEISGRGVGMDVVRKEIEALRGSITMESTPGKGTLFRIELPLTLAVIEGLLVGVGRQVFVIPLLSVVETIQPCFCQFESLKQKGELVKIRNHYVPLLRLHQLFGIDQAVTDPARGLLILVAEGGGQACLLVDEIIDQYQVVIKSLEQNLMSVEGIAGATILGDGRISLVLDIASLIRHLPNERGAHHGPVD